MKKTMVNMTKANAIKEIKVDNKLTVHNTIKEVNNTVSNETLYPTCVDNALEDTFIAMVHRYGFKVFRPKKGGIIAKQGKKRIFELYNVSDERVHLYAAPEVIQVIIKKKYMGFLTENPKWGGKQRFEFLKRSWLQFCDNGFEKHN